MSDSPHTHVCWRITGSAPHNALLCQYVTLHYFALRCIHLHIVDATTTTTTTTPEVPVYLPLLPYRAESSSTPRCPPSSFTLKVAPAFLFSLFSRSAPNAVGPFFIRHLDLQLFNIVPLLRPNVARAPNQ